MLVGSLAEKCVRLRTGIRFDETVYFFCRFTQIQVPVILFQICFCVNNKKLSKKKNVFMVFSVFRLV